MNGLDFIGLAYVLFMVGITALGVALKGLKSPSDRLVFVLFALAFIFQLFHILTLSQGLAR